jgi:hypothetical protein
MPLKLAPAPSLDLALVLHQGELLHQAELMIELGEADPGDLEDLLSRAYEYTVLADAGRVALCVDTKVKLREVYEDLKRKIKEWRKEQARLLKDIEGGDV